MTYKCARDSVSVCKAIGDVLSFGATPILESPQSPILPLQVCFFPALHASLLFCFLIDTATGNDTISFAPEPYPDTIADQTAVPCHLEVVIDTHQLLVWTRFGKTHNGTQYENRPHRPCQGAMWCPKTLWSNVVAGAFGCVSKFSAHGEGI